MEDIKMNEFIEDCVILLQEALPQKIILWTLNKKYEGQEVGIYNLIREAYYSNLNYILHKKKEENLTKTFIFTELHRKIVWYQLTLEWKGVNIPEAKMNVEILTLVAPKEETKFDLDLESTWI